MSAFSLSVDMSHKIQIELWFLNQLVETIYKLENEIRIARMQIEKLTEEAAAKSETAKQHTTGKVQNADK